jgi:glycosyltransferase involved in cell wall biosynthesis
LDLGGITSYLETLTAALAKKGHRSSVVSSGGNARERLERAGARCYDVLARTKSELDPRLWRALPRLVSLVKEERFDVLHAHTRVAQVLAFFLSKLTRVPVVSTAHGFYQARLGRRLFPAWGERVIAISPLVAESLERAHGLGRGRIRVVPNAIDLEAFERRLAAQDRGRMKQRYGLPPDSFVVGSLSRLVRDKGHEYLVEAVRRLTPEFPKVYLLIVGDGRERRNLERLAAGLRAKIVPGVQDTTEVLAVMDAFAHPATHREGFGLSIAEAMAAKLPVVATDVPAINTLIVDGQNGRVVTAKDAPALAHALADLIRDPARARQLGLKGHETAVSVCRPGRMADEVEAVYEEVCRGAMNRARTGVT